MYPFHDEDRGADDVDAGGEDDDEDGSDRRGGGGVDTGRSIAASHASEDI